jgi:hypothetical protein
MGRLPDPPGSVSTLVSGQENQYSISMEIKAATTPLPTVTLTEKEITLFHRHPRRHGYAWLRLASRTCRRVP